MVTRGRPWTIRSVVSFGAAALLPLVVLLAAASTVGAAPTPTPAPDETDGSGDEIQIVGIERSEDVVILDVAVPPAIGRLAPVADNFGVTDGGQLVELDVEQLEKVGDSVLVLDTSGSMQGSALAAAKAAAISFVEALPNEARVGLIGFDDSVVTYQTPTLERAGLLADIEGLTATGRETVLWDALLVAADLAAASGVDHSSIVVLSDGDDTASIAGPTDAVSRLNSASLALYAVAIESPDTDLVGLEETVARVGGHFVPTSDIGELDSVYTDIAGRLANRYRLQFTPAQSGTRTVVVSVAAGSSVATAQVVLGAGPTGGPDGGATAEPGTAGGGGQAGRDSNEQSVLGTVAPPTVGRLSGPALLGIGLGSMFAAFAIVGLIFVPPATQVRLDTAAGVDRIGGITTRLGEAADELIARHDRGSRIDAHLEAADVNLRPGEVILAWLLSTAAFALAFGALFGVVGAVLGAAAGVAGGVLALRIRASRRRARFADQLTETLAIIAGSLRSGQSLHASIELVAAEAPSPTAEEFHRIAFEVRVGRDLTESIRHAARRTASQDLDWVANAVDINRELGGDLSEIMDNLAATIRERRAVSRQIDALSAEGRATGWVLLVMPVLLFAFNWWRTPDNIATFVTEPLGRLLLLVAVTGMTVGHLWIRHLVKLKY